MTFGGIGAEAGFGMLVRSWSVRVAFTRLVGACAMLLAMATTARGTSDGFRKTFK